MLTAAVIVGVLAALDLAVSVRAIWRQVRRWDRRPRPYACIACRVEYSDARALAWHFAGQHVDTYDHAVVSRHGAQGEPATGPVVPHETAGDGSCTHKGGKAVVSRDGWWCEMPGSLP